MYVEATPWLDHVVRAGGRYNRQRGNYYAAGITYFTMLALFPILMVAFSVVGFALSRHPALLMTVHDRVVEHVPGEMGSQIGDLIDRAVNSRGTVGIVGVAGAFYAGTNWIANLRAALTEQWEQHRTRTVWWRAKLSDIAALFGLLLAMAVSLGLSAVSSDAVGRRLLRAMHLDHSWWGVSVLLRAGSVLLATVASWALFTWIIARLPREPLTLVSAMRAGVLAAGVFELFKQIASYYLTIVLHSPAGVVFGPVLGTMVFAYFTYRIILFATAWAATAVENMRVPSHDDDVTRDAADH